MAERGSMRIGVLVGGIVAFVGLVGIAVILGVFLTAARKDSAPALAVTAAYTVSPVADGTEVSVVVEAVEGLLPEELEVAPTEVDPRFLNESNPEQEPRQLSSPARRTDVRVTRLSDRSATVIYTLTPRPDGRRTVVLGTPFTGTRSELVTASVTGEVISCLVPVRRQTNGSDVWAATCPSDGPTYSSAPDQEEYIALAAWVRLVLAAPA
ncbi:hypothetical protein [Knoellia remsis]|nr:hypothetical protein [Knoellia remsis]